MALEQRVLDIQPAPSAVFDMLKSVRAQVDAQTGTLVEVNNRTIQDSRAIETLKQRVAEYGGELSLLRSQFTPAGYESLLKDAESRLHERIEALVRDSVLREAMEKIAMVKYSGVIGDRKVEVADALKREREYIAQMLDDEGFITTPTTMADFKKRLRDRPLEM